VADPLDVLSAAEALAAVHAQSLSGTRTAKLAMFVTGISRRVDELCGPVVQREVVERHSPGCFTTTLELRSTPVASVTSVVEWAGTTSTALVEETDAVKPAQAFLLVSERPHQARLLRRSAGSTRTWQPGDRNVVVTYQAGRAADTASVDPLFKLQVSDILAYQWQQASAIWATNPDAFDDLGGVGRGFLSVDDMIRRRLGSQMDLAFR